MLGSWGSSSLSARIVHKRNRVQAIWAWTDDELERVASPMATETEPLVMGVAGTECW